MWDVESVVTHYFWACRDTVEGVRMSGTPPKSTGAALVLGGGVAGIQCSLDLAEGGYKVYLVEKAPALGGHMAQLDKTFPTNDCSMCTWRRNWSKPAGT